MGSERPLAEELSTVTLATFSKSGNSNIVLRRMFSSIDLNPLAVDYFQSDEPYEEMLHPHDENAA